MSPTPRDRVLARLRRRPAPPQEPGEHRDDQTDIDPDAGLVARVAALEDAVEESRRLNQRLSDVLDVVTELLVPAVDRDDERLRAALAHLDEVVPPPAAG